MKMNEKGQYYVSEQDDMFIEDAKTGEKMVFLLDQNEELVIRSILEEDIKSVSRIVEGSSSERRNYIRILYEEVPKAGSEEKIFVAERIIGDECENIYEEERELIGIGVREDDEINFTITKDIPKSESFMEMLQKMASYYGIEGVPIFCP